MQMSSPLGYVLYATVLAGCRFSVCNQFRSMIDVV